MATGPSSEDERTTEVAIFARLIKADDGHLSRELAGYILTLGFEALLDESLAPRFT